MGMLDGLRRLATGVQNEKVEAQKAIQRHTGGGYAKAQREEAFNNWFSEKRAQADLWAFNKMRQYMPDAYTIRAVQINRDISKPPEEPMIRRDPDENRVIELDDYAEPERTPQREYRGMKGSL